MSEKRVYFLYIALQIKKIIKKSYQLKLIAFFKKIRNIDILAFTILC